MIYLFAVFLPPLGLLLNGQPFAAILNVALMVPCLLLGFIFHVLWLVPSLHAVIAVHMRREQRRHREIVAVHMRREQRRHREIVAAIERHGASPGWR